MPRWTTAVAAACAAIAAAAPAHADRWQPQERSIERYNEGADALNTGDPEGAEQAFRKVLKRDPGCGIAALGLGIALHRQQRSAESARALQGAAAAFPERAEIFVALSETFFGAQDFDRARAAAEQSVAIDPRGFEGWAALNTALLRIGDLDAAAEALGRGRLYQGEARMDCLEVFIAAEAGDEPASIQVLLNSCLRVDDPALVSLARSAMAQAGGDYEAMAVAADELGAGGVSAFAAAAATYEAGDPAGAEAALDALLESQPSDVDARSLRARIRHEVGDLEGTVSDLQHLAESANWIDVTRQGVMTGVVRKSGERAVTEIRVDAAAWLAGLYLDASRDALALQALSVAEGGGVKTARLAWAQTRLAPAQGLDPWAPLAAGLAANPDEALLLNLAGEMLLSGAEGAPESIYEVMASAAAPTARYNLAAAYVNAGDCAAATPLAEALRAEGGDALGDRLSDLGYRCALRLDDLDAAESWGGDRATADQALHHAWLLQQAGRHDDALTRLDVARAAGRDDARADLLTVISLSELGRLDAALEAVAADDVDPEALMWLASSLLDADRLQETIDVLRRACPRLADERATECADVLDQLTGD